MRSSSNPSKLSAPSVEVAVGVASAPVSSSTVSFLVESAAISPVMRSSSNPSKLSAPSVEATASASAC